MKSRRRISSIGCGLLMMLLLQTLGGKTWAAPNNDLIQAIQEKNIEGVRQALENGADANAVDEGQGSRSFMYTLDVAYDRLRALWAVTSLVAEARFINCTQPFGAVFYYKVAVVALSLQQEPFEGLPPLLMVMQHQDNEDLELIDALLQYGADVNATVPHEYFKELEEGWTALIKAADNDDIDMVTLLLRHGADVNITTNAGDSALLMAEARHNPEIVDLLTQAGATPLDPEQQARAYRMRGRLARDALHTRRCGTGGCIEGHDLSYEHYTLIAEQIPLPEGAEHIDWFFFAGWDTNYEFAQASVKQGDIDLKQLVTDCLRSRSEEALLIENASFSMEGFHRTETETIPHWWNDESGMQDFPVNVVKFGEKDHHGFGCWAFYNEKTHTLKMFRWGEQWLSVERFCNVFNIEACKENDAPVQPVHTPSCPTNKLQQFAIHDLQLTGIILGGLGDYARVQTPDGFTYTIQIGTRIGKHEGEVVAISENSVRVKERIQDEHGRVEEVETLLSLHPLEE